MADDLAANRVGVLAVFPAEKDHVALGGILTNSRWRLHSVTTLAEACLLLQTLSIGAVISERSLPDGHGWKDLLAVMQDMMDDPPPLIVVDRLADERMWAEVLNLGAHNLLMKPFDAKEVLYVVSVACSRWNNRDGAIAREVSRPMERAAAPAADARGACGGSH